VRLQVQPGEELTPGRLQISARAEEVGDNHGEIDAAVEGDNSKIAFNSKYLQNVLNLLSDGKVVLETQGLSQPGVNRPTGSENCVHVLMPMLVQWCQMVSKVAGVAASEAYVLNGVFRGDIAIAPRSIR
jgi:DNA polymerase III subunit beta